MARRHKSADPVLERRRVLALQGAGLAILTLITLFFVYKGLSVG
ncbi:hypothetical protein [Nocardioides sp.]|nr:hypothetical protein [Nocardioides sp.]MDP3894672.1 hypothetical protein [Nocardioides sp.]